ncbi:uncharacterized protein LOC100696450 isoform X2 [Oreochromis niloticus]|uniref:uncharacterized protein LOC100696450 isoform X2 n=1 Tax=Oreochromis niloticus TaxID=8128 RepID=UPI0009057A7E|nr:uncharacterized protein LOC100696450 isoform X2 [Oreochromis niloticus]
MKLVPVFVILAHISQHASGVEVEVYEGEESVLLPCQVPAPLSKDDVVVWRRDDLNPAIIHTLIKEHDDIINQNPRYTSRTSVQKEALHTGDLSLTLRNPTVSDSGTYICTTRSFGEDRSTTEVQLKVKVCQLKAVDVTEGAESVLLPFESKKCKREDIIVEWKRIQDKEIKAIVYEQGQTQHHKNNKPFRRRTEMKKDPRTTGNASLTLRNVSCEDGGVYICTVCDNEGKTLEQQVVVLLVHEGWLKTIRGLFHIGTENNDEPATPLSLLPK